MTQIGSWEVCPSRSLTLPQSRRTSPAEFCVLSHNALVVVSMFIVYVHCVCSWGVCSMSFSIVGGRGKADPVLDHEYGLHQWKVPHATRILMLSWIKNPAAMLDAFFSSLRALDVLLVYDAFFFPCRMSANWSSVEHSLDGSCTMDHARNRMAVVVILFCGFSLGILHMTALLVKVRLSRNGYCGKEEKDDTKSPRCIRRAPHICISCWCICLPFCMSPCFAPFQRILWTCWACARRIASCTCATIPQSMLFCWCVAQCSQHAVHHMEIDDRHHQHSVIRPPI